MQDQGSKVVSLMQKMDLLEVLSSGMVGDAAFEITGRSDSSKAGVWGGFMQNVLNLELRSGKKACIDFSRYYRLVSRRVVENLPQNVEGPKDRLVATATALVWNWRVRFNADGAALLVQECTRQLNLKAKQMQAMESLRQLNAEDRARVPIQQAGIPEGIQSVEPLNTGTQASRPTKNVY